MRVLLKRIIFPLLHPLFRRYFSKTRWYRYKDLRVQVFPGVFTPYLTFSTRFLLQFSAGLDLAGKSFLELGSGCGIIAIQAARKGATATAVDINPVAVKNTAHNALLNKVPVKSLQSDLFAALKEERFDCVMINPPYYPRDPQNDEEKAWYCGAQFQYFDNLFRELPHHFLPGGAAYMILSEDCEIGRITSIAKNYGVSMKEIARKRGWWETNYIFRTTTTA